MQLGLGSLAWPRELEACVGWESGTFYCLAANRSQIQFLITVCFKKMKISSFLAYRRWWMPILHLILWTLAARPSLVWNCSKRASPIASKPRNSLIVPYIRRFDILKKTGEPAPTFKIPRKYQHSKWSSINTKPTKPISQKYILKKIGEPDETYFGNIGFKFPKKECKKGKQYSLWIYIVLTY